MVCEFRGNRYQDELMTLGRLVEKIVFTLVLQRLVSFNVMSISKTFYLLFYI